MAIEDLRKKIDSMDDKILGMIEERVDLAKRIGIVKRKKNLPIEDADREGEVLARMARKTRLKKDFVRKIFEDIISYCREVQ
ncbi:MAG: chorismate mutase [Candidatus Altiarchaeota archaeon]